MALAWGRGWRAARFPLESVLVAAAEVEEGEGGGAGHVADPAFRRRCLRTGPVQRCWGLPPHERAGVQGTWATVREWPQFQHRVSERRRPALAAPLRYLQLNLCPDSDVSVPGEEVLSLWSSLEFQELLTSRVRPQRLGAIGKAVLSRERSGANLAPNTHTSSLFLNHSKKGEW